MVDVKLDFLPERKRKILLKYPFITDFFNEKANEKKFLENFEAFKKELKGIKASDIILYKLVEKIRREAGFTIYAHGGGRADLNDFPPGIPIDSYRKKYFYTRGFYKIRDWRYGDRIDFASRRVLGLTDSGIITLNYREDFDTVTYGQLPIERRVTKKETKMVRKPLLKGGILGLKEEKQNQFTKIVYGAPLNKVIQTNNTNLTCHLRFSIRTPIEDYPAGRRCSWPSLIIVCDKSFMEQIKDYIWENPSQYDEFIGSLVDKMNFPNINKGILDKRVKPSNEIIFFYTDRMYKDRRKGIVSNKLLPWVIKAYGKIRKK
jgi:hypothetical protein